MLDTGAAVSVVTSALVGKLGVHTARSNLSSLKGVSGQPIPILGIAKIPINISPQICLFAHAHVVHSLPGGSDLILGQPVRGVSP